MGSKNAPVGRAARGRGGFLGRFEQEARRRGARPAVRASNASQERLLARASAHRSQKTAEAQLAVPREP
jgi:hypothetical protein